MNQVKTWPNDTVYPPYYNIVSINEIKLMFFRATTLFLLLPLSLSPLYSQTHTRSTLKCQHVAICSWQWY